ncbi:FAS1-like dehydratase domain-containing protein [Paractinoplanes lichenicola]|uniref:MaoC family dehydratase N-terminal domain-containing protein n=1 Tax=Paractinoplanes lichenicola TaxID=2802976 RepID=A0ABS1VMN0_9ACTN|nr:MaoC family dehydratase N-terminal domain-containing protein [Actinoplanes lichenicola]MBL7255970.1 MaoC family dehydratase N-terminal domain-containing protein [Actinoplanes lichenicola]
MTDPWIRDWDPMIDLVGTDLSDGEIRWGADRVEAGTIRRYLEPIELGSPIHYDLTAAQQYGHPGLVAPATSLLAYTLPAMWSPGQPTNFSDSAPDAQPDRTPINNADPGPAPATTGFFATDMEIDFLRPVHVGERLGSRGRRLLACTPKETRVGRGAFMTTESDIVADNGDVVARMRTSVYAYNPHPTGSNA